MGYCTSLPDLAGPLAMLFFIISCALDSWSVADITYNVISGDNIGLFPGDARIGLWMACAEVEEHPKSFVFSEIGECRYGHCTTSNQFAKFGEPRWTAGDLCGRSATVQAFSLFAIGLSIAVVFVTSWRRIAGKTVMWGRGVVFSFFAALSSLIAWAAWLTWASEMNDTRPASQSGARARFGDLSLGPAVNLQIVGWLLMCVNTGACYVGYVNTIEANSAQPAPLTVQLTDEDKANMPTSPPPLPPPASPPNRPKPAERQAHLPNIGQQLMPNANANGGQPEYLVVASNRL